ncbi:hypothetical protein [Andreprevotia sp. IGB-42]|uniref:hypothetical protein n=1 Tax=Andreprevotia sp. IGB-42 TaxID=2497473 RepID=UPI001358735D|nr:hypothetical protein [Andreprevotia sp. IGB-42]
MNQHRLRVNTLNGRRGRMGLVTGKSLPVTKEVDVLKTDEVVKPDAKSSAPVRKWRLVPGSIGALISLTGIVLERFAFTFKHEAFALGLCAIGSMLCSSCLKQEEPRTDHRQKKRQPLWANLGTNRHRINSNPA